LPFQLHKLSFELLAVSLMQLLEHLLFSELQLFVLLFLPELCQYYCLAAVLFC